MKSRPGSTIDTVRDFWQSHVNNEYYTDAERASDSYFDEIEQRRYRTHYHLREFFASITGEDRRLLEIGCGIGVDSIQLAKRGFQVTAIDLTENALALARQFAARRGVAIDFRLGNAERLDFPDQSFDAVYSFGVLHHTPDPPQAFRQLKPSIRIGKTQQADELLSLGLGGDIRANHSGGRIHIEAPLARLLQLAPVAGLHHSAPKLCAGFGRDLHLFHVLCGLLRSDGAEIRAPGLRGDV